MPTFFSSSANDVPASDGTVYRFREPTFGPARQAARPTGGRVRRAEPSAPRPAADQPPVLPTNYGDIVEFFRRTVAERRSPYNQLCRAADQLKDYIPNEINRLQVAYGMLKEQLSPESLSLAISTHIGDIDLARQKAAKHTPEMVAQETRRLSQQIDAVTQRRDALAQQLTQLQKKLAEVQSQFDIEDRSLTELRRKLDATRASVNSAAFLDQAAENEKNDLLAKKALLGLP